MGWRGAETRPWTASGYTARTKVGGPVTQVMGRGALLQVLWWTILVAGPRLWLNSGGCDYFWVSIQSSSLQVWPLVMDQPS